MSKTIQIIFTFSACLILNINTAADVYSDLNKCANIKQSLKRLHCFETMSKVYLQNTKQNISTETENAPQVSIDSSNDNVSTQQPSQQLNTQSDASSFGLTKKETTEEESVKKIVSQIIGPFSSWTKGMKLQLKNGQVWKVVQKGAGFKKMTDPKITITRGFLNTFNAKVEGIGTMVKVKRIK